MNHKKFWLGIVGLCIVLGIIVYWIFGRPHASLSPDAAIVPVVPPPVVGPGPSIQGSQFENEYMKIAIPTGWELIEATETLQNQVYDQATGQTRKTGNPVTQKTGAINLIKDSYILYINPNAGQASGVTGGRFGEIAGGAPSADAVIVDHPSPPCNDPESSSIVNGWVRDDLYVDSAHKPEWCAAPTNGKTVWYFSYITTPKGGYFNYYENGKPSAYVITMAYNSKDINSFPVKGSAQLTAKLTEMTDLLKTLELKKLARVITSSPPPNFSAPLDQSGIQGIVTIGPTCPVQRFPEDSECEDKPYQTTIQIKTMDGKTDITEFKTGADGKFKVSLIPGTYMLVPTNGRVYPQASTQSVTVAQNKFTSVTVQYDSGIR